MGQTCGKKGGAPFSAPPKVAQGRPGNKNVKTCESKFAELVTAACKADSKSEIQNLNRMHPELMSQVVNKLVDRTFPLAIAYEYGSMEVFKCLVEECGALPFFQDERGMNVLMMCSREKFREKYVDEDHAMPFVEYIMGRAGQDDLYIQSGGAFCAVNYACFYRRAKILKYFLENCRADPSRCDNALTGMGLLSVAIQIGDWSIVNLLLKHDRGYLTEKDYGGFGPLCIAANEATSHDESRKRIFELVLKEGTDIFGHGWNGNQAIHFCALHGQEIFVVQLLDEGAKVSEPNFYGLTPLHVATMNPLVSVSMLKLLVGRGADINARAKNGDTILHIAVRQQPKGNNNEQVVRSRDVLEFIMSCKIRTQVRNVQGLTAPELAIHLENLAAIEVFTSHGYLGTKLDVPPPVKSRADGFVAFASTRMENIDLRNVLVIRPKDFLSYEGFPRFNECRAKGWHISASEIPATSEILFISHRWGSEDHPDPFKKQFQVVKSYLHRPDANVEYIWLDYSCISQDKGGNEFKVHLQNIPTAVWLATQMLIVPRIDAPRIGGDESAGAPKGIDISDMRDYISRAWCVLEAMAAFLTETRVVGAYVEQDRFVFEDFGRPQLACSSLGFFPAQERAFQQRPPPSRRLSVGLQHFYAQEVLRRWEFQEPCELLSRLIRLLRALLPSTGTGGGGGDGPPLVEEILTLSVDCAPIARRAEEGRVSDDANGGDDDFEAEFENAGARIWQLLGDCSFPEDKAVVFNLLLFIGFYSSSFSSPLS